MKLDSRMKEFLSDWQWDEQEEDDEKDEKKKKEQEDEKLSHHLLLTHYYCLPLKGSVGEMKQQEEDASLVEDAVDVDEAWGRFRERNLSWKHATLSVRDQTNHLEKQRKDKRTVSVFFCTSFHFKATTSVSSV